MRLYCLNAVLSADLNQVTNDLKPTISQKKSTSNTLDNDFLDKIFDLTENNMSNYTYWFDDLSHDMHVSRSTLFRNKVSQGKLLRPS